MSAALSYHSGDIRTYFLRKIIKYLPTESLKCSDLRTLSTTRETPFRISHSQVFIEQQTRSFNIIENGTSSQIFSSKFCKMFRNCFFTKQIGPAICSHWPLQTYSAYIFRAFTIDFDYIFDC